MFKSRYIKLIFVILLLFAVANVSCLFHFEDMGQHSECAASHHLLWQIVPSPLAKVIVLLAVLLLIANLASYVFDKASKQDKEMNFYAFEGEVSPLGFLQEAFSRGILNPKIY